MMNTETKVLLPKQEIRRKVTEMVKVKYGKQVRDIEEPNISISSLKSLCIEYFNLGDKLVTMVYKGRKLLDENQQLVEVIGMEASPTISIIASSQLQSEGAMQQRIRNDLPSPNTLDSAPMFCVSAKEIMEKERAKMHYMREYKFHSVKVLEGFADKQRALSILNKLANDPGVLHVLAKHKFHVYELCEMYPEGQVGISEVCVLGLNQNHGQKILLRLRTDDLKGFRNELTIRKVLFHELAHNVHGDHNAAFFQLMNQIEAEVNAFNAQYRPLSDAVQHRHSDQSPDVVAAPSVFRVGSATTASIRGNESAKERAAAAAMKRLSDRSE